MTFHHNGDGRMIEDKLNMFWTRFYAFLSGLTTMISIVLFKDGRYVAGILVGAVCLMMLGFSYLAFKYRYRDG